MELHVAYTIDVQGKGAAQFVDQLKCGVYCLRQTLGKEDTMTVHIVCAHLPSEAVISIGRLQTKNFKVDFRPLSEGNLRYLQSFTNNQPTTDIRTWSGIVFARIFLAKELGTVDRVIYLDVDTMVRKPLNDLWTVDLGGCYFGMARGHTFEYGFSSGVMLMDLARMRKDKEMWSALETHMRKWAKLYYLPDQTVINQFFKDYIHEVPVKWNYPPKRGPGSPPGELEDAAIWHWYFPGQKWHRPDEMERCNAIWFGNLEMACAEMSKTPEPSSPHSAPTGSECQSNQQEGEKHEEVR